MKAILEYIFLPFIMVFGAVLAFSGPVSAHHATDELNLLPGDESDICVDDGLQIRVTVNGVTHQGIMKLEIYASQKNFLNKKGRLRWTRVEALDGPMRLCLDVPAPGTYAIAGYHDLDGNRKLGKKWDFTPKEPFGLSNDPKLKRRKFPKFADSAFEVPETGADITLNLIRVGKKQKEANADVASEISGTDADVALNLVDVDEQQKEANADVAAEEITVEDTTLEVSNTGADFEPKPIDVSEKQDKNGN